MSDTPIQDALLELSDVKPYTRVDSNGKTVRVRGYRNSIVKALHDAAAAIGHRSGSKGTNTNFGAFKPEPQPVRTPEYKAASDAAMAATEAARASNTIEAHRHASALHKVAMGKTQDIEDHNYHSDLMFGHNMDALKARPSKTAKQPRPKLISSTGTGSDLAARNRPSKPPKKLGLTASDSTSSSTGDGDNDSDDGGTGYDAAAEAAEHATVAANAGSTSTLHLAAAAAHTKAATHALMSEKPKMYAMHKRMAGAHKAAAASGGMVSGALMKFSAFPSNKAGKLAVQTPDEAAGVPAAAPLATETEIKNTYATDAAESADEDMKDAAQYKAAAGRAESASTKAVQSGDVADHAEAARLHNAAAGMAPDTKSAQEHKQAAKEHMAYKEGEGNVSQFSAAFPSDKKGKIAVASQKVVAGVPEDEPLSTEPLTEAQVLADSAEDAMNANKLNPETSNVLPNADPVDPTKVSAKSARVYTDHAMAAERASMKAVSSRGDVAAQKAAVDAHTTAGNSARKAGRTDLALAHARQATRFYRAAAQQDAAAL